MSVKLQCPHCATPLKGEDEIQGQQLTCPKCQATVSVPWEVGPCPFCFGPMEKRFRLWRKQKYECSKCSTMVVASRRRWGWDNVSKDHCPCGGGLRKQGLTSLLRYRVIGATFAVWGVMALAWAGGYPVPSQETDAGRVVAGLVVACFFLFPAYRRLTFRPLICTQCSARIYRTWKHKASIQESEPALRQEQETLSG